ncbi:UrcA family protein [Thermaurantiacus sp.]
MKLAAILSLVAAATGTSLLAAPQADVPGVLARGLPAAAWPAAVRIRTDGLDLTTVEGRARLDLRIARAAAAVCDPEPNARAQALDKARAACVEATIAATEPARRRAIAEHRARGQKTAALQD